MAPCDSSGREYNEADDMFVDSPDELVGKEVNFVFKIVNCRYFSFCLYVKKSDCYQLICNFRGLPNKYTDVHCQYRIYLDDTDSHTEKLSLTANPDFNHVKLFKFNPGTRQVDSSIDL